MMARCAKYLLLVGGAVALVEESDMLTLFPPNEVHTDCGALLKFVVNTHGDPEARSDCIMHSNGESYCSGLNLHPTFGMVYNRHGMVYKHLRPVKCSTHSEKNARHMNELSLNALHRNCQFSCSHTPTCNSAVTHQNFSYCKLGNTPCDPAVCFGLYYTDRGDGVCYQPNDPTCPETRPVLCTDRYSPPETCHCHPSKHGAVDSNQWSHTTGHAGQTHHVHHEGHKHPHGHEFQHHHHHHHHEEHNHKHHDEHNHHHDHKHHEGHKHPHGHEFQHHHNHKHHEEHSHKPTHEEHKHDHNHKHHEKQEHQPTLKGKKHQHTDADKKHEHTDADKKHHVDHDLNKDSAKNENK